MIIGNKVFENYTYIMAIVNLTPDSFYAHSRATGDDVLFRVERAIKEGAAVIDVGAQSTRPGYTEVPPEEEIARFEKPLYEIKRNFDIPLSVDTYFHESAEAALGLGADMINDICGLSRTEQMAQVIAKHSASVCIMHNAQKTLTGDIFPPVLSFLSEAAKRAESAGIPHEKIVLDGGIGFAKSREDNWKLLENYEKLSSLGYPLLLGASRKSLFGGDAEDRLAPTLKSTHLACGKGVLFVRVHDVKENAEQIKRYYGGVK